MRARTHSRCVVLGLAALLSLATTRAWAGRAGLDLDAFRPQVDGRGFFSVESPDAHAPGQWSASFWAGYGRNLLGVSAGGERALGQVDGRLTATLTAAIGLARWLELGFAAPVALYNSAAPGLRGTPSNISGLGMLRFVPKLRVLDEHRHGVGLAFLASLHVPTGNANAFLGHDGVAFAPEVVVGGSAGPVRMLANLGYVLRPRGQYLNLVVGDELTYRAGVGVRVHERVEVITELLGATSAATPFGRDVRVSPLEWLLGARATLTPRWQLFVGGGPGLTAGYGTPSVRLFAGLSFGPHTRDLDGDGVPDTLDRCPTEPGPSFHRGCPFRDRDGDGVADEDDRCPDIKGLKDNGGCPLADTDADGTPDRADACPREVGPKENKGCPWPDGDGDGVLDKDDLCAALPGPKENKGCPWPDLDGDGVPDKDDRCSAQKGPRENAGCPWPDGDGDGLPDKDDRCPKEAGPRENGGCPWPRPTCSVCPVCPTVAPKATAKPMGIEGRIRFRYNSAVLAKSSATFLDAIADKLRSDPRIERLEVHGHTDDIGTRAENDRLSLARAEVVRKYLLRKSRVPKDRIVARGFGERRPIQPVDPTEMDETELSEARKLNRRVEFLVVERAPRE